MMVMMMTTAMTVKSVTVLWVVTLYSVEKDSCFGRNISPPPLVWNSESTKKPPEAGYKLTDFFSGLPFDPEVEVVCSSGMPGCLQATQYNNPEGHTVHM